MKGADVTAEGLRAAIGFPSAVMLVIGGIVGVGVFVNPAVVARSVHTPGLVLGAWIVGGCVALLGALVYGELAARVPETGGEYAYLRAAFGPLAAFLFGWTTLLVVQAGGMAAVAIIFAQSLGTLVGGTAPGTAPGTALGAAPDAALGAGAQDAIVVAVLAGLALVNGLGVRAGNAVQAWLGAAKVAAIVAVTVAGLALARPALPSPAPPVSDGTGLDLAKAFGAALIPVVFSYGGWQTAACVAGEVKDARRVLAPALLVGVMAVAAIYLLVTLACLRVLGAPALGRTLTPTSDVLARAAGPAGLKIAAAAIALSALGFLSQAMLTGPRITFAMARDGLFFRRLAKVDPARHVPSFAIALQAAWACALALTGRYEQILSYVVCMNFLFFGVCAAAVFALRRRQGAAFDGFRAPGHPWTTGLFILACAGVVGSALWSFPVNSLIGFAILLAGVPAYLHWRGKAASARAGARAGKA